MSNRTNGHGSAAGTVIDDIALTENARKVLEARYLKRDEAGACIETAADLFRRVAAAVADVEVQYGAGTAERQRWEDRFFALMTSGAFMPNSPTLMNAGREMGMLSACFVLPVRDSITDIFDSIKHTALIQKAGGGTGFAFDELRPTGDYIASSGGTTSGPITFWKAFSEATNAIQQGAFRRGANMGMMYVHHPDILKFLHAKQDLSQFTNYNISVKITDGWMDEFLAEADSPQIVRNPRTGRAYVLPKSLDIWKYDIRNLVEVHCVEPVAETGREKYYATPRMTGPLPPELAGQVYTKRDIWTLIVENAWQTGEPGVVYIDRINEHNPTPHVGRIEATNPCGEQPLLPYEACNLGSVNLGLFIRQPCTPQAEVDWGGLQKAVHDSVRFLDNVIDANNYPLDEIDRICKANRKIGLGIMGFADALYKLSTAYNSPAGVEWGERFMKFVNDQAHIASENLARDRGCFPNWAGSIWQTRDRRLMRNAATTTVAPTGTISIISNCSGGIEPMFSLAFIRNVLRGQKQGERPLVEVNETFLEVARRRGFYSPELVERIAREGTLAHIDEIPADVKRTFVCAHDITPEWHMQMQAAFQRHCDSSISKTINFPHEATATQVDQIYRLAYELGCKGVTVYRDGCRQFQPMALKKEGDAQAHGQGSPPAAGAPATSVTAAGQTADGSSPASGSVPRADVSSPGPHPAVAPVLESGAPVTAAARPLTTPLTTQHPGGDAVTTPLTNGHEHGSASGSGNGSGTGIGGAGIGVTGIGNGHRLSADLLDERVSDERVSGEGTVAAVAAASDGAAAGDMTGSEMATGGRPSGGMASLASVAAAKASGLPAIEPLDLPEIVSGLRIRQMTPFGNMHVAITVDPRTGRELEIFAQLGKGGDVATSDLEGMCRVASLWLRAGGSLKHLVKQWAGIGSSLQIPTKAGRIMSLPDGLACALKKYIKAKERFGLRPLLLGDIDLSELDSPPPPHGPRTMPLDRTPERADATHGAGGAEVRAVADTAVLAEQPGLPGRSRSLGHSGLERDPGQAGADSGLHGGPVSRGRADVSANAGPRSGGDFRSTRGPADALGAALGAELDDAVAHSVALLDAELESIAGVREELVADELLRDAFRVGADGHTAPLELSESLTITDTLTVKTRLDDGLLQTTAHHTHEAARHYKLKCPQCDGELALQEGCKKCYGCGWSAC